MGIMATTLFFIRAHGSFLLVKNMLRTTWGETQQKTSRTKIILIVMQVQIKLYFLNFFFVFFRLIAYADIMASQFRISCLQAYEIYRY